MKRGDNMADMTEVMDNRKEESAVQCLHRLTGDAKASGSDTLGSVIAILEKIGITCMIDDSDTPTAGFPLSEVTGLSFVELSVEGRDIVAKMRYPFDVSYEMLAVVAIMLARLNHDADDVFFKLDIHSGRIGLESRYRANGRLRGDGLVRWLGRFCDLAVLHYRHLELVSDGIIGSFEKKFFGSYIDECAASLSRSHEGRRQYINHTKDEGKGKAGPGTFEQMLLRDIDEEISRRKKAESESSSGKATDDDTLDLFEFELEDD